MNFTLFDCFGLLTDLAGSMFGSIRDKKNYSAQKIIREKKKKSLIFLYTE